MESMNAYMLRYYPSFLHEEKHDDFRLPVDFFKSTDHAKRR